MNILAASLSRLVGREFFGGRPIQTMLAFHISLLIFASSTLAAAVKGEIPIGEALALPTQELMNRSISSAMQHQSIRLREFKLPLSEPLNIRRMETIFWRTCGFGTSVLVEQRATKLPIDPTLVLGDSYLKCRKIDAALMEPIVSVASYPPGYFGGFVYEGLLVSHRFEFSDEAVLQKIFKLLVEAAKEPDDWDELVLDDWEGQEQKLADYRKTTGFTPEFVFEFVGANTLRIEFNPTRGRLLIVGGEKWDGYSLDQESAAELRGILEVEKKKAGTSCSM